MKKPELFNISQLANLFPVALMIFLLFLILKPTLNLPLPNDAYVDLRIIQTDFGKNLSFLYPSIKYYFHQYGTQFTSILIAYKLFGFNPKAYFILNITLRIAAALAIYLFTVKWTKSKLAGFFAGVFFGVNLAGIQPTTRVAFFLVYVGIIALFIFLDRWLTFHYQPTEKNLKLSALFFALAILSYPVRMVGTVPLTFLGEIYWLFKDYCNKAVIKLWIKHILILTGIILLFVFVTGTLASTPELSYKRISTNILLVSLLTGYPPVITTLWLFISNLIISPLASYSSNFDPVILNPLTVLLPFLSILLFLYCILRRKFLLAFASVAAVTFVPLVMASSVNLEGWNEEWIIITQVGGTIFILSNLFLIYMKDNYKRFSEVGILGSILVISTILFPWLISPQQSVNDQSAFNFIHRYYTPPSAGMGLLLGCVVAVSLDYLKKKFKLIIKSEMKISILKLARGLIFFPILVGLPVIILFFTYWQAISSNSLLISQGAGADVTIIETFWNKIAPFVKDIKSPPMINYIYIDNKTDLDEKYITSLADRITITLRTVDNPPNVIFIFNKLVLQEVLQQKNPNDYIYAYRFDGKEIVDIKNELLNIK